MNDDWMKVMMPMMDSYINSIGTNYITTRTDLNDKSPSPEQVIKQSGKGDYICVTQIVVDDMEYNQNIRSNDDARSAIKSQLAQKLSKLAIEKATFTQMKNQIGDVEIRGKLVIMSIEDFAKILQERI